MKYHAAIITAVLVTLTSVLAVGCGDDVSGPTMSYPTIATFGHEVGVDMLTGEIMDPGNFANSDLFAKANGDALKLYTGGPTSAKNRPVEWFQTGGTADHFQSLDEVPNEPLPTADGLPLNQADTGNGFIVIVSSGQPFKGRITAASATSVTVEYEPIP